MVNTTTFRPIPLHTGSDQILISRHEQEMVINQLLTVSLFHAKEGEVLAGQVTFKFLESALHEGLHFQSLFFGDSGAQTKSFDTTADTDTSALDGSISVDIAFDLVKVHVRSVAEVLVQAVVFKDEGIEDIGEIFVGISISSINATMLIIVLDGTSDGLKGFEI